ncbi:hypothetical protein CWI61_00730, partial [Neisseria meningitidis]
ERDIQAGGNAGMTTVLPQRGDIAPEDDTGPWQGRVPQSPAPRTSPMSGQKKTPKKKRPTNKKRI